MSKKIKVGVFGAERGMTMIKVLADHPDAELVAVCDKFAPLLEKVTKLAEEHNTKVAVYESFDDFFNHDMDAVVLANYANEHAPYAIRLLRSGRHVLSEVLPCETMAQAVELIEAVEESGKIYSYAENYCYRDDAFEMWRRRENGDIGEVTYVEGEYVHDCTHCWPFYTYGEKNHWRNRMHPAFYCTHSVGPMMTITGQRPVEVAGFETIKNPQMTALGALGGFASGCVLMLKMDKGAIGRSLHGGLKREPSITAYQVYGTRGMMETARFKDDPALHVYIEGDEIGSGDFEHYNPKKFVDADLADKSEIQSHGGSDFYTTHFFLEKILGRESGIKYALDVYQAVDMGICGILGFRSILNGGAPVKIPNLKNKDERDAYRNDNACTNKAIAGDQLLPCSGEGESQIPDSVYDKVKKMWENKEYAK